MEVLGKCLWISMFLLFRIVSRAREAVLDAHFLVLASDLGKEKAKQLRSDLNSFDMLRYVETLVSSKLQNRNKKCFICHIVYDYTLCLYPYADGFHLFTLLFGPEIPPERSYQIKHMTIEQWWNLDWEFRAV